MDFPISALQIDLFILIGLVLSLVFSGASSESGAVFWPGRCCFHGHADGFKSLVPIVRFREIHRRRPEHRTLGNVDSSWECSWWSAPLPEWSRGARHSETETTW